MAGDLADVVVLLPLAPRVLTSDLITAPDLWLGFVRPKSPVSTGD